MNYHITSAILRFEEGKVIDGKPSWNAFHKGYDYPEVENVAVIGVLKWDMMIEQYCYYPECPWWHKQIILSEKLLNEITEFIKTLK